MNRKNRKTARAAQAEERRRQIMDVALNVFADKGYKGTSIKDIAEAAGISQGLLYYHFTSKEKLFMDTVESHTFLPELRRILAESSTLPSIKEIKEIAFRFIKTLESRKSLSRIIMRDVAFNPKVSDFWTRFLREVVSLLQKYIEQCIESGELKPHNSEVSARSILSNLIMFHITQDIFQASDLTVRQYVEEFLDNLCQGIENK
jgi:TetR/AcrR family transcriptional regulator, cholesterol catabolism regulator